MIQLMFIVETVLLLLFIVFCAVMGWFIEEDRQNRLAEKVAKRLEK